MDQEALFTQRLLKSQGIYLGALDGLSGPQTIEAIGEAANRSAALAERFGKFGSRSEAAIATLHLRAQEATRKLLGAVAGKLGASIVVKIVSGTRTYAEQDALYAKGRTAPGNQVTRARGGQSNHNFGIAWDIGIFDGSDYLEDSPLYADAADVVLAEVDGIEWGGNWKSITDEPHFQLATGHTLREIRALFEAGSDYVNG